MVNLIRPLGEISESLPLLSGFATAGYICYSDLVLAEQLLRPFAPYQESAAAFLCHLAAAVRFGHLCVKVEKNAVFPSVESIWENSETSNANLEEKEQALRAMKDLVTAGIAVLPTKLITEVSLSELNYQAVQTPLCLIQNKYYLHRYWYYETYFLYYYNKFVSQAPALCADSGQVEAMTSTLQKSGKLLAAQAKAIQQGCHQTLTIICGGPGTGKTYTAGQLINILWHSLAPEHREKYQIALAAPTGKAAANLQKSLLAATQQQGSTLSTLQAKTLHALLNIHQRHSRQEPPIPLAADLVIIDECSMIDARLMGELFAALKPGARLILLGDNHQLPAVEAGSLFADLIQINQDLPEGSTVCQLTDCLRAELQTIVDFAATLNAGDFAATRAMLNQVHSDGSIKRFNAGLKSPSKNKVQPLLDYALTLYRRPPSLQHAPEQIVAAFNEFRMLSPLRKGPFGIEEINRQFLHALRQSIGNQCLISPILINKNDHRLELFNGDVGVLVRLHHQTSLGDFELCQGDYALFPSRSTSNVIRKLPALLVPSFEYAYCMSIHKSQGSEFNHVLLLLPEGSEIFGRELLYTGATRARQSLEIWTEDGTLEKTLRRRNVRHAGIAERQKALGFETTVTETNVLKICH